MSLKRYGIYLLYPPVTDLRGQGLGRHLAAFLRSAQERTDVRFAVVCPSWMRQSLEDLCDEEGVDPSCFDIIAPARRPLVLKLRDWYQTRKRRPKRIGRLRRLFSRLRILEHRVVGEVERWLVSNRSVGLLILFAVLMLPVAVLGVLAQIVIRAARKAGRILAKGLSFVIELSRIQFLFDRLRTLIAHPSHDVAGMRLFGLMEEAEIGLMHALIRDEKDILAWYCSTPFWPYFNRIAAPRLICVPDIVPADFPGGFTLTGGKTGFDAFRQIEAVIAGGDHFVTYSDHVKWHTLVDRWQVDPDSVDVVPHGASRLDEAISVSGWDDDRAATDALCRNLFKNALGKAVGNRFAPFFGSGEVKFLFYASQFRPNKNVVTLLRAFDHLLKQRYRGYKLVLTGDPKRVPEIAGFIREHNLENDVLCLNGLSVQELAACYRLTDLAINPSLSEGGFPFTFTEAISVGTPVVMARIPVTAEIIGELEFYSDMSFDPYDWRDMADRIEWALDHRDALYARQRAFYDAVLIKRSWRRMVDDYIVILERISTSPRQRDEDASSPRLRVTNSQ